MRYLAHFLLLVCLCAQGVASAVPNTPTPTPSPTPVPLRIGAVLDLSGKNAIKAEQMKQALELAIEKLRLAGGVNGRPVEFLVEDSGIENNTPGTIIRSLVTEKHAEVLIGDVDIEKTQPLASLANTYRTPLLSPALHDGALSIENQYAFGMFPRRSTFRSAIQKFFSLVPNLHSLVIFCSHTALGLSYLDAIHSEAQTAGLEVKEEICTEEVLHDFRVDVTKAQGLNPDSLFLSTQTAQIVGWMKTLGLVKPVLASAEFRDDLVLRGLLLSNYEGVYFISWPVKQIFIDEFKEKTGKEPTLVAALAYDAIDLIVAALRKSPDSITIGLHQTRDIGVTGSYDFTNEQAGNGASAILHHVERGSILEYP